MRQSDQGYSESYGVPKGEKIYYKCLECRDVLSSASYRSIYCRCYNIMIDAAYIRLDVKNFSKFAVLYDD